MLNELKLIVDELFRIGAGNISPNIRVKYIMTTQKGLS